MVLPLSRTSAEAHLYLELHSCDCGERSFGPDSAVVVLDDGDLGRRYTGACPRCGRDREFTFRLPADPTPPSATGFSFGGSAPSELIDPGEWLAVSDEYAAQAPAETAGLSADQSRHAGAVLARAVAALDEVLKFIPEGTDAVPPTAFFTDRGREVYQREPGRFRRDRLTAVRQAYAGLLHQFA
ncbi:hypothetical protein ACIBSW_35235 [Actinoplanes sp. NPDC049668]|uniref:hypothetical protein n=1 Tax=unclassified Actinoplanes TaxID=2626549 RepID=UPI0033B95592